MLPGYRFFIDIAESYIRVISSGRRDLLSNMSWDEMGALLSVSSNTVQCTIQSIRQESLYVVLFLVFGHEVLRQITSEKYRVTYLILNEHSKTANNNTITGSHRAMMRQRSEDGSSYSSDASETLLLEKGRRNANTTSPSDSHGKEVSRLKRVQFLWKIHFFLGLTVLCIGIFQNGGR